MLPGSSYDNSPALWVAVATPHAVPDATPHNVYMCPVCEHPGKLHAVDVDAPIRVDMLRRLSPTEVQWLRHAEAAVRLCGHKWPHVELSSDESDAKTSSTFPRMASAAFAKLQEPSLQPVWRPTSKVPLWVCAKHAALYRRRDDTHPKHTSD